MWFMLLIALEGGQFRSEIILPSLVICEAAKTQPEDLCIAVNVSFADTPA